MRNKNKGFTLIEMLVVIAVIGLLAALILVGLSSFRTRGRDTRRIADVKEIQNGLELYYMKSGEYPQQTSDMGEDKDVRAQIWNNLRTTLLNAGLGINEIPQDPTAPSRSYAYISNGQHYVISVPIEDPAANSNLLHSDIDNGMSVGDLTINSGCGNSNNNQPDDHSDAYYCVGM